MAVCAKCEVPIRGEHTCPVRTAGDYALLHANGMSFREIVNLIRVETLEWKAAQDAESVAFMDGSTEYLGTSTTEVAPLVGRGYGDA